MKTMKLGAIIGAAVIAHYYGWKAGFTALAVVFFFFS
jgi:hypothetical protein